METLNSRQSWNIVDEHKSLPLEEIDSLPKRAISRLARSTAPILESSFIHIAGAISMMSGMDYHYCRFCEISHRILPTSTDSKLHSELRHETVAWVNRVGQFHYFANSELVRKSLGQANTPNMDSVMPFRNKHTAHRSVDAPRKSDSEYLKVVQGMSLSELGGTIWHPRSTNTQLDLINRPVAGNTHYAGFQIQMPDSVCIDLFVELAHPQILLECYSIFEQIC